MPKTIVTTIAAFVLAVSMLISGGAAAQSLNELRASGAVGERYDGYLVQRSGGGNVASVVASVNAKRREIYQKQASKTGASVSQVGQVYAGSIRKSAPGGTWFQDSSGRWSR